MLLPGGLMEGETRARQWAFKPVSGRLELTLCEAAASCGSVPRAVTQVLSLALATLGEMPVSEERVANLCVGDRQFLMRELEGHLGKRGGWFHADCSRCATRFDFSLQYADLPVQEAGPSYPLARVQWQGRQLCFRLPTGADQERLLQVPGDQEAAWLLRQLLQEPATDLPADSGFQAAVDAALDEVAPGIVTRIQATCPECGTVNTVELDPYRVLSRKSESLLVEIHQLASCYHWSESDILALPRSRRRQYLDLIDRSRGMTK